MSGFARLEGSLPLILPLQIALGNLLGPTVIDFLDRLFLLLLQAGDPNLKLMAEFLLAPRKIADGVTQVPY